MITEPLRVINFVTFDEGAASIWMALLVTEPQTRQSPLRVSDINSQYSVLFCVLDSFTK